MKKLILITTLILLSIVSYSQTFVKHGDLIVRNNGVWVEHGESVTLVTSINVASLSEAVIIDTDGGSLDFEADVSPDTAADTTLTWSYIAGTGTADFETEVGAPTLTALTDGTVTVRATANDGSGVYGEVEITISNQTAPSNMVANGTFDNTDYWTLGSNLSISGGTLNSSTAFNQAATQSPSDMVNEMQPGVDYTVSFDVSGVSAAGFTFLICCDQVANFWVDWDEYTNGSYSIDFTTTDPILYGGTGIQIRFQDSAGGGSIDNFTIVER